MIFSGHKIVKFGSYGRFAYTHMGAVKDNYKQISLILSCFFNRILSQAYTYICIYVCMYVYTVTKPLLITHTPSASSYVYTCMYVCMYVSKSLTNIDFQASVIAHCTYIHKFPNLNNHIVCYKYFYFILCSML